MENPGMITFNDTYLYGEKVSVSKLAKFATTIAH
jgi:aminopeptidase N